MLPIPGCRCRHGDQREPGCASPKNAAQTPHRANGGDLRSTSQCENLLYAALAKEWSNSLRTGNAEHNAGAIAEVALAESLNRFSRVVDCKRTSVSGASSSATARAAKTVRSPVTIQAPMEFWSPLFRSLLCQRVGRFSKRSDLVQMPDSLHDT